MQFSGITPCRKEVIDCKNRQLNAKKGNKASILIGQWRKKLTDSQSNASPEWRKLSL